MQVSQTCTQLTERNRNTSMNHKKISTYLWEQRFPYLIAISSMVLSVFLDLISPQLTTRIIDDVIVGGQLHKLNILLAGILAVGIGRFFFQYIKEYTFDITGIKITAKMRHHLFDHIQSLSADFFDRTNTGELMARLKDDIDRIGDGLTFVGMLLMEVIIHTSIILFFMYRLDARLALIPTASMIIAASVAIVMERKLDSVYEAISEETAALNTIAEENLAGVRTVKAFAREKFEIKKFLSHNQKYYDLNMRQSKIFVTYYPYLSLITKLLPLIILLTGGALTMRGELSLGSLGAFVEYSMNIVWPMEMLGWLTNSFSAAVASNRKLEKIYAQTPTIVEKESPTVLEQVHGNIEFSHVCFAKLDEGATVPYEILNDISFTVEEGKSLGIMGATGAGKSSIIHLLQRFYDTTQGSVRIDHVDGVGLSGGQKQRISIARALAKKNPILVLDDSTSALDMETEQLIQNTLRQLEHTTKIIIAHRISSVMHADEIIVLENGSIRERGNHETLMAAKGLYYQTYAAQYQINGAEGGVTDAH